jgi:hypothetical protein
MSSRSAVGSALCGLIAVADALSAASSLVHCSCCRAASRCAPPSLSCVESSRLITAFNRCSCSCSRPSAS